MKKQEIEIKLKQMSDTILPKTYIDDKGVRRMSEGDETTPSPSRLSKSLGIWVNDPIPSHMIIRSIKTALETHNDNYKMLLNWNVASWKKPVDSSKSIQYAAMIYEKLSTEQRNEVFLNQYGVRGSKVHEAIETFINTGMEETLEDDAQKYFDGFKKWSKENKDVCFLGTEVFVTDSKFKIKGVIDGIAFNEKTNELIVIDFKTNSIIKEDYIAIQLVHYKKCLESFGIDVDKLQILQLKKNGTYEIFTLQDSMFMIYNEIWTSLYKVFSYGKYIKNK